jgi:hypothetical protein
VEESAIGAAFVAEDERLCALRAGPENGNGIFLFEFRGEAEEKLVPESIGMNDLVDAAKYEALKGLVERHQFANL